MASPSSNQLVAVESFMDKYVAGIMMDQMGVTKSLATVDWNETTVLPGQRGATALIKAPTRFTPSDSLEFDVSVSGSYTERAATLSIDQKKRINFGLTDTQQALNPKTVMSSNFASMSSTIASVIDQYNAQKVAFAGYRFFGDPIVQSGQNETVGELTKAASLFRSFGGQQKAYYGIPNVSAAALIQSGLQQFVSYRNEEMASAGDIGALRGVSNMYLYEATTFPVHISGTAADNDINKTGARYNITSITPNAATNGFPSGTSTLVLEGMTDGDTILENDLLEIGTNNASTNPITFLSFDGYLQTPNNVQARVVTGDTVSGGAATITIEPALVYSASLDDPTANLSRAIITGVGAGADTVQFATSHRAGAIYLNDYGKFASPELPSTDPFENKKVYIPELGLSLRMYKGYAGMGSAQTQWVYDTIYGTYTISDGFMRVLYSIN